jgi:hypothetical protein
LNVARKKESKRKRGRKREEKVLENGSRKQTRRKQKG